uniref:Uncharacterized protein n=1 Tax=Anguilla anguilla TaxID=7936 RepID=A0A0E9UN21_ANGAN
MAPILHKLQNVSFPDDIRAVYNTPPQNPSNQNFFYLYRTTCGTISLSFSFIRQHAQNSGSVLWATASQLVCLPHSFYGEQGLWGFG